MDSDGDSEGPEDVGFSDARTSAVQRTKAEAQKAKDALTERKAARTKKQAWFREAKVQSGGKRKAGLVEPATQDKKDKKASRRKSTDASKSMTSASARAGGENSQAIAVENDLSDIEGDEEPTQYLEDHSIIADATSPAKRVRGAKVVSLDKNTKRYGAWRSDAAKFAQERFNPPSVKRISAAKWTNITVKRAATRTPR
ncbi:hypothetical protein BV898_04926 [Hypsibius exemplaris]|uniref:Uncharacterized protein n=1 Tax=Hypsibius exemplaris TaxID=2072580 RepID=A0A1W0X146_HYPEX|nr:hypothetical protein BV898_04926 [Hypsibius exemplaris]